jgi:glycosyltransferase involved in cell wall biosynthesis
MKILIFNWRDIKNSWAGGSEIYIHEIAKRLVARGSEVTIFCGQDIEKNLPEEEVIDGVRIIRKGGRFGVYFWAPVYYLKRLRKHADIIIDVQNGIPFFTQFFSVRKKKFCLVHHVHGEQFFYEFFKPLALLGFLIEKYLFPFVYKFQDVIAVSKTTKNELVKIGFNPKRIKIVYNGIYCPKSASGIKKFSRPTIIYLGRIKRYKRIDLLIKLMPEILKKVPNARLLIAGWGTEGGEIANVVMRGNVRRHVEIFGPVSNVEKKSLLSRSWVFVNPSIHEGWSISVLEANSYGTPAVAFRVPGLSESIVDGKTGVLCDSKDNIADCISSLLLNKNKRDEYGKNAKKWAEKFSWDKSAKEFSKVISES